MTNAQQNSISSHQELMQLLPWYVNKSIKGSELIAVEKHLSTCLLCKRELIHLQKLAQAIVHDDSFDSAEKASFARLKNRLHSGQPVQHQAAANEQVLPLTAKQKTAKVNKWYSHPVWAIAATVLLALLVPFSATQYQENPLKQFRTLSSGEVENLSANEIRVVFADKVDDQKKNIILERIGGQIVDEPTEQGAYTIQLNKNIAANQILAIVELLRKDQHVVFAEPAYSFLTSIPKED